MVTDDWKGPRGGLWWDDRGLHMIDQTKLPGEYLVMAPTTVEEVADAIRTLKVRGAPAIGIAAAFGLHLALTDPPDEPEAFRSRLEAAARLLRSTRPTAVNLFWAIDRVVARTLQDPSMAGPRGRQRLLDEALDIWHQDEALCRRIGEHGKGLLADARQVLTHCNAGSLATGGWGTATAPLYALHQEGRPIAVLADETRPLLQGARLTAWELQQAGIPVTVITDSMAATVLQRGLVDAVIVGADRIAANGDAANKIGTYGLAILAKEHGVPFYVAAPFSTFDLDIPEGKEIPVEERAPEEVTMLAGQQVAAPGVSAHNFAFDVTPARYITAIITDRGVLRAPYSESIRHMLESTPDGEGL